MNESKLGNNYAEITGQIVLNIILLKHDIINGCKLSPTRSSDPANNSGKQVFLMFLTRSTVLTGVIGSGKGRFSLETTGDSSLSSICSILSHPLLQLPPRRWKENRKKPRLQCWYPTTIFSWKQTQIRPILLPHPIQSFSRARPNTRRYIP